MAINQQRKRQIRQTSLLTVGLFACLAFGIVVLATGDWIPGTIIVVAAGIGLLRLVPVIRKLCCGVAAPSPPESRPVS